KKECLECGEPVLGRIDKKFCSDQCRNTYNNRLNSDCTNYIRQVNYMLRKNRRIIAAYTTDKDTAKVPRNVLERAGFNFDYITSIYTTRKGKTYFFCYDQGYLPLENEWFALVRKKA